MLSNSSYKQSLLLLGVILTVFSSIASGEKGRKGSHRKPPAEAFTACADETEAGGACSFSTPEGDTIEGTCKVPRKAEAGLVCATEKGRRSARRKNDNQ